MTVKSLSCSFKGQLIVVLKNDMYPYWNCLCLCCWTFQQDTKEISETEVLWQFDMWPHRNRIYMSSLSCLPELYLWGSPFWVRFLHMWPYFNPTTEVVTFHLHGWCMLGVFLLPAFTHLGHGCQWNACVHKLDLSLYSPVQWNACVHRLDLSLYSHPKEF